VASGQADRPAGFRLQLDPHRCFAEHQPGAAQPLPQHLGQPGIEVTRLPAVRAPPDILVMDEVLDQVEPLIHARQPEHRAARRAGPDALHELRI